MVKDIKALKKAAPPLPPDTCGLIDIAKSLLDNDPTPNELGLAQRYLERLRAENAALRASSRYWYKATRDILAKGADDDRRE